MKQLLLVLLFAGSNFCEKLDKNYLPSRPDPFNNGEISDTVLRSATPSFPHLDQPNGSVRSDARKYLPPAISTSLSVNNANYRTQDSIQNNDRLHETSGIHHTQIPSVKEPKYTGISTSGNETKSGYGIQNNEFTRGKEQFTDPSKEQEQYAPNLNENIELIQDSNRLDKPSGYYYPKSNRNAFRTQGIPTNVNENKPNYNVLNTGLDRQQFTDSPTNYQNTSNLNVNDGLIRNTDQLDAPYNHGHYSPNSNVNVFTIKDISSNVHEGNPEYGIQIDGTVTGTESSNRKSKNFDRTLSSSKNFSTINEIKPEYSTSQDEQARNQQFGKPSGDAFHKNAKIVQYGISTPSGQLTRDTASSKPLDEFYGSKDVQPNSNSQEKILRYDNNINVGDRTYSYRFDTSNGIHAKEEGSGIQQVKTVHGVYSYTSPEGEEIYVEYFADKDGYHPKGSHVPEIPAAILRSIEYNKAEEARNKAEEARGTQQIDSSRNNNSDQYNGEFGHRSVSTSDFSHYPDNNRRPPPNLASTPSINAHYINSYTSGQDGQRNPLENRHFFLSGNGTINNLDLEKYEYLSADKIPTHDSTYRGYNKGKYIGNEGPNSQIMNIEREKEHSSVREESSNHIQSRQHGVGILTQQFQQKHYPILSNNHREDTNFSRSIKLTKDQDFFKGSVSREYANQQKPLVVQTEDVPLRDKTTLTPENNKFVPNSTTRAPDESTQIWGTFNDKKAESTSLGTSKISSEQHTSEIGKFESYGKLSKSKPYFTYFNEKAGYKY